MPSLFNSNSLPYTASDTTGLYGGRLNNIPNSAETLLTLLSNNGSVSFSLDPESGNIKVKADDAAAYTDADAAAFLSSGDLATAIITTANITANTFIGDGSQLTGLPAGYSDEEAMDAIAGMLTAGSNITLTYDDASDTLTIDSTTTDNVVATVVNKEGVALDKGTPVYATSTGSQGQTIEVGAADASDSAKMPAIGVLNEDLAIDAEGEMLIVGYIQGIDTETPNFSVGDVIWVAAGGGFTNTKPTGESNLLQNLGKVSKVHLTNGGGIVQGAGRSAATPNLNDGNIFIGNASNQSSTATLDTDIVPEGSTNQYYTTTRHNTDFDTRLATKSTTDLAEGTNQYYTDERVDDRVNALIIAGNNLTKTYDDVSHTLTLDAASQAVYTDENAMDAVAGMLTDGTGISSTYDDAANTYTISSTITQYTDADAIASISGGTGITYNNTTGVIDNDITQYTDTDARASISSGTGITYNSSTGVIDNDITQYTDTDARGALSGSTGITYNSGTGAIAVDTNTIATVAYVDEVAQGLQTKPAVNIATTANLTGTYNNGTLGVGATLTATSNGAFPAIDGITLDTQYQSILLKDQTNKAENGRWVLTTVGDVSNPWVLTRCGLCDEADEIPSAFMFVSDGTTNEGSGWVLVVDDPTTYVVGTDDINVYQFSGAGTYTAGTGISISGTTISSTITQYTDADAQSALSVSTATASGNGSLAYNNATGVFTHTPADVPTTLTDLSITDGTNGQILSTNGAGTFTFVDAAGGGVALTDLSVSTATASGNGSLAYNDTNGVFTFTPADVPTVLTDLGITDGTSGQVLTTNGTGSFTFTTVAGGGGDLVDDTTPQLGGTLDTNGFNIVPSSTQNPMYIGDSTQSAHGFIALYSNGAVRLDTGGTGDLQLLAGDDVIIQPDDDLRLNPLGGNTWIGGDTLRGTGNANFAFVADTGYNLLLGSDNNTTGSSNSPYIELDDQAATKQIQMGGMDNIQLIGNTASTTVSINAGTTTGVLKLQDLGGTLQISGINYPKVDGSNGQVLTTDGAGNLSWTTAAGGGISEVVDDTTPTLGGNLDLADYLITNSTGSETLRLQKQNNVGIHLDARTIVVGEAVNGQGEVFITTRDLYNNTDSTATSDITIGPDRDDQNYITIFEGTTSSADIDIVSQGEIRMTAGNGVYDMSGSANIARIELGTDTLIDDWSGSRFEITNDNRIQLNTPLLLLENGGGAMISTDTGQDLFLAPNNVYYDSVSDDISSKANAYMRLYASQRIDIGTDYTYFGDSTSDTTLTTNGAYDMILRTNGTSSSGTVKLNQGLNANIDITPNGTGATAITNLLVKNEKLHDLGTTGGTITPSMNNGSVQKITLNSPLTINALSGATAGSSMTLIIYGGTAYTSITSTMKFAGGDKLLSGTSNAIDVLHIFYDGTNYLASINRGYA